MSAVHRAIYGERKRLGFDDDTARAFYRRSVGKDHLTQMSDAEHRTVLTALRAVGTAPTGAGERPSKASSRPVQGPYGKKLTALWIAMWNLGLVRDRSDAALISFVVKRIQPDHTRWLTDANEGRKVVEALKDWMRREAGVMFGNTNGCEWLRHDAAKVAWAQWRILYPESHLLDRGGFDHACFQSLRVPYDPAGLAVLKPAAWQKINRAWGPAVRKARKP